jgi:cytochrome b subunit of formate dehydrogenase
MFFLGLRAEEPQFKRFSYVEKAEYWALVWGTLVMTLTGLLLWFDNYFVQNWALPKVLLDVALVIHFYEAWLAALAILVWHIYGVMLKPTVYPMNTAWLSGRMSKHLYAEEHPDGPKLKARTVKFHLEEEEEEHATQVEKTDIAVLKGTPETKPTDPSPKESHKV